MYGRNSLMEGKHAAGAGNDGLSSLLDFRVGVSGGGAPFWTFVRFLLVWFQRWPPPRALWRRLSLT